MDKNAALEAAVEKRPARQRRNRAWNWRGLLLPLLAIVTALIIGALVIVFTDESVYAAFREGVGRGFVQAFAVIGRAYGAFFTGAFGNPVQIVSALASGNPAKITRAVYPITETLRIATPYIFAGLAVALGFQGGLFNIGAEGQYFIAGLLTVFVGYSITGLPQVIHLPLALLAGMAGGALWAAIPGYLKGKTGAHEVINTIMMNYIAFRRVPAGRGWAYGARGRSPSQPGDSADGLSAAVFPQQRGAAPPCGVPAGACGCVDSVVAAV